MTRDTFDKFDPPARGRFGDHEQERSRPRVTGASDLHDLTLVLHYQTERAVLVSIDGEESKAVWLPKSAIEPYWTGYVTGRSKSGQAVQLPVGTVTVPERLAVEKRLL